MGMNVIGWAVVPIEQPSFCITDAPSIFGGGTLWQIYQNEKDAEAFCQDIKFSDATYFVVKVEIAQRHDG
jgi:hypothetical protein